jgi:tetratricopeptide (TPR) repeat protein
MLASVRLSQVRNDEAREALQHSLQLWINKDPGDPSIPIYDTRLALVKLLLELQLYAEAFSVLERLQQENDQSVDLWYLWGWSYYCLGDEDQLPEEERKHHWEDARDCLETSVKVRILNLKKGVDDFFLGQFIDKHAMDSCTMLQGPTTKQCCSTLRS